MADSIITDVFKFLAIRPTQRVSAKETGNIFIRDERTATPEGKRILLQMGRSLAQPGEAMRRYEEADLTKLQPLADMHRQLTVFYETASLATDQTPQPADSISATLPDPASKETKLLTEAAWDVVYAAYESGPDAGPKLETPMAALQILHFAKQHSGNGIDGKVALQILRAKPVIPFPILEGGTSSVDSSQLTAVTPAAAQSFSPARSSSAGLALIEEYDSAKRLLTQVRTASTVNDSAANASHFSDANSGSISKSFAVSTLPALRDALGARLSAADGSLLQKLAIDSSTKAPSLTQTLQDHLTALTEKAYALRDDPNFVNLVKSHSAAGELVKVFPPIATLTPNGSVGSSPDVNVTGRIRPLGIGDLKVVKQKLLAYLPGEVAHIENILKGESKQRIYRTLDRTETTLFSSEETTEETERDTQSTDRFELKKESEQTIKSDMSVKAGVTVTGVYGPVTVTAQGDFAYSTSKQDSAKSSANFARDVVDRSVSKVQKKVKTERTTKTFHEAEETDTHGVDNSKGAEHVVGVYRWVDKKYRAQVYNYGKRLMLEFVVPEPSAYFRASQMKSAVQAADAQPPVPFLDLKMQPLTASDIDDTNYQIFASRYNAAGVTPSPAEWLYAAAAFEQNNIQNGQTISKSIKDIVVPDGYKFMYYNAQVSAIWENFPQLMIQIGTNRVHLLNNTTARRSADVEIGYAEDPGDWDNPKGVLAVSVIGYDINAFAVNIGVNCLREKATYAKWQLETFDKIYTAYKALKTEYDQKVKQAQAQAMGIGMDGRNPAINLEIIQSELKKLSLTMLTGKHFNGFHAMTNPVDQPATLPEIDVYEALNEGPIIQFFEQAFDWEQITYLFYPYFWGRKTGWIQASNQSDPDPLFSKFLQAGAARIVVAVSPAYNDAVLYFLQKNKVWGGGGAPTIDDKDGLYTSIADELREQTDDLAGAIPEGAPWEFTVPTTLVWLQGDAQLPVFA